MKKLLALLSLVLVFTFVASCSDDDGKVKADKGVDKGGQVDQGEILDQAAVDSTPTSEGTIEDEGVTTNSGKVCTQEKPCPTGESCIQVSSVSGWPNDKGICVGKCSTGGAQCATTVSNTFSACALEDQSGNKSCIYFCQVGTKTYSCPESDQVCATLGQNKVCIPGGTKTDGGTDLATDVSSTH